MKDIMGRVISDSIRITSTPFYTQDSLTGQDLRVVTRLTLDRESRAPRQLDVFTSDASTDGSSHDHDFVDYVKNRLGSVSRGQQK